MSGASPTAVWLVMGDKAGDNGQLEVIGEALATRLGWRVERRRVAMRAEWVTGKPRVEASLHHIDPARSDRLEPPWPDIVLTIGRRPSMAALWVRGQSGGRTRIVRIGKPTGRAERFDLVIASAEVQIMPGPGVLRTGLPLMRVDEAAVRTAGAAWRARLAGLPRPLMAVLLGGPTGPYRFGHGTMTRLEAAIGAIAAASGTPYVTTSRRTPDSVARAMAERLPPAARMFRWTPDAIDNPYRALLTLADGCIVSGDSISMMVEVARLGRPLQILALDHAPWGRLDLARRRATSALFARATRPGWRRLAGLATRAGMAGHTRDFEAFHAMLRDRGLAAPLGAPLTAPCGRVEDDIDRVVDRIADLARS